MCTQISGFYKVTASPEVPCFSLFWDVCSANLETTNLQGFPQSKLQHYSTTVQYMYMYTSWHLDQSFLKNS